MWIKLSTKEIHGRANHFIKDGCLVRDAWILRKGGAFTNIRKEGDKVSVFQIEEGLQEVLRFGSKCWMRAGSQGLLQEGLRGNRAEGGRGLGPDCEQAKGENGN